MNSVQKVFEAIKSEKGEMNFGLYHVCDPDEMTRCDDCVYDLLCKHIRKAIEMKRMRCVDILSAYSQDGKYGDQASDKFIMAVIKEIKRDDNDVLPV